MNNAIIMLQVAGQQLTDAMLFGGKPDEADGSSGSGEGT